MPVNNSGFCLFAGTGCAGMKKVHEFANVVKQSHWLLGI